MTLSMLNPHATANVRCCVFRLALGNMSNMVAHTDEQRQAAASRLVLRAGGLWR